MPSTFRLGICDVTTSTAGAKIQFNIVVTVITIEFSIVYAFYMFPIMHAQHYQSGCAVQSTCRHCATPAS